MTNTRNLPRVATTIRIPSDLWEQIKLYASRSVPELTANSTVEWLLRVGLAASEPDRLHEMATTAELKNQLIDLKKTLATQRDTE